MADSEPQRVLSIQSHVVSGYVGNRAATFPLQTLGYEVDAVNSVQFSNHTGYGHTNGHKTTPEQLQAVFDGLITNGLVTHTRALTGYIPGAEALKVVAKQISDMREQNPDLIYVLDPVMGDIGRGLYVSEDVVPIYKDMLKLATIITPNQFEVELLSGISITSLPTLHAALSTLHNDNNLAHIAFSSIPLPVSLVSQLALPSPPASYLELLPQGGDGSLPWYTSAGSSTPDDDVLVCFASSSSPTNQGQLDTWAFALPTVHGYFAGVGDLFSAMVLAHFDPERPSSTGGTDLSPLAYAVSKALMAVQQILLLTHLHSLSRSQISDAGTATPRPLHHPVASSAVIPTDNELDSMETRAGDPKRKAKRMKLRELRIIPERRRLTAEGEGWPGKKLDWESLLQ